MAGLGKLLLVAGLLMAAAGALILLGVRLPWLGRLPGDIAVERPAYSFYFPVVTCVVLSIVISLLMKLFGR